MTPRLPRRTGPEPPHATGYHPALDGLRAFSIMLVLAAHAGLSPLVPGGLGVAIFFAVSGFLITTRLLDEQRLSGRIRLGRFFVRRALRLVPAALAFVAAGTLAYRLLGGHVGPASIAAAVFDVANLAEIFTPLFDHHGTAAPHPFVILWSLAIEEQFYLLWPPLLACALARAVPTRALAASLGLLALLCLLWRVHLAGACVLPPHGGGLCGVHPDERIYKATDTRLDSLGFGALAALLPRFGPRRAGWGAAAALALLAATLLVRHPFFRETLRDTLQGAALLVLVPAVLAAGGPLRRALESAPLVATGRLSYGLYLWHWLALMVASRFAVPGSARFLVLFVPLTALLALLSWTAIERPVLRLRRRFGSNAPGRLAPTRPPGHALASTPLSAAHAAP